mgnify:CR=1 FL=1
MRPVEYKCACGGVTHLQMPDADRWSTWFVCGVCESEITIMHRKEPAVKKEKV